MLKSMTAYGRATHRTNAGECVVEIHAVNRKMLEIVVLLPKELLFLDLDLRKWIQEEVYRGQVTVRVSFEKAPTPFLLSALKDLKAKWQELAEGLGYSQEVVNFSFLTEQLESLPLDISPFKADLKKTLQSALKSFIAMRRKEGAALTRDLNQKLSLIKNALKKIEKRAPIVLQQRRKRLEEKVKKVSTDEKWISEVAIFAEKADITEEITRLHSHLGQFLELLEGKEKSVGRTLDFLTQEMGREINTLSSKAAENGIVKMAIFMRSEIEKMREQVQNIE